MLAFGRLHPEGLTVWALRLCCRLRIACFTLSAHRPHWLPGFTLLPCCYRVALGALVSSRWARRIGGWGT